MKIAVALMVIGSLIGARAQNVTVTGAESSGNATGHVSCKVLVVGNGSETVNIGAGPNVKIIAMPADHAGSNNTGSCSIDLNAIVGQLAGSGKNGAVKIFSIGPNGTTSNISGQEVGAILAGILKPLLGGAGGNVSVSTITSAVGVGEDMPGKTADITAQVARALKEAGVENGQATSEILKQIAEALKQPKDEQTGQ